MLAAGSTKGMSATKPFNLRNEPVVCRCYESTAAAYNVSSPQAENFEYQTEVNRT